MPAEKRTAEDKKKAKPQERKFYVRLKRGGQHGEEGLARFYLDKKLYKRDGIYRVDQKMRVTLKRTGKFEDILADDLDRAKETAKSGRGMPIQDRERLKRREAQRLRRRRFAAQVDDEGDDLGDDYELTDEDVDPEVEDDDQDEEQVAV